MRRFLSWSGGFSCPCRQQITLPLRTLPLPTQLVLGCKSASLACSLASKY
jgi:hypothetical protein